MSGNVAKDLHQNNSIEDNTSRRAYDTDVNVEIPRGAEKQENQNGDSTPTARKRAKKSMFSTTHLFSGDASNIYTDEDFAANRDDFLNPTIFNLLTKTSGANKYDINDFNFVKRFEEIANNRLITLRRFAYPCVDDIFNEGGYTKPDIGRMLTYSDQEINTLGSIFNMTFGVRWKELESVSERADMLGNSEGSSGWLRNIMSVIDPQYGKAALQGEDIFTQYDPQFDSNKVYGEVDSIANTHIRDIGLNFEQPIVLTFEYELRSIKGINPKSAFLDLLSQILVVTTNEAKFWGGARYYVGYRPSKYARDLWKQTNSEFISNMNKSHTSITGTFNGIIESLSTLLEAGGGIGNILKNASNLAFGKLLNKIGRASIPMANSLLQNEPVGEWHLTVGNPLRPTMSIGNLLLESTNITVGGEKLGHDDFPTSIRVECTLKHGMPRGRAGIESMFTMGNGRMYWKPSDDHIKEILKDPKQRPTSIQSWSEYQLKESWKEAYAYMQKSGNTLI